jgi:endonuclease/exonuclease/phosphatase family metal-dependent hydrolase
MSPTVRVVTWNLWWRFGAWQERHEAIAAQLAATAADIICLQEVWATETGNLAGDLAQRLTMHWTHARLEKSKLWQARLSGTTATIGNAILSRWPIKDTAVLQLPAGDMPSEGRTAISARIAAPGCTIPVFTTQFNSQPAHSAIRVEQTRALALFISERRGDGFPAVVTGDLNAEPDSDEVRLLCGHKTAPAVPGLVLVDSWRYAENGDVGWTWDRANPHVLATHEPSARIDYILVGLPARVGGQVQSARRIGHQPVTGTWPSDHAGVVADLRLTTSAFDEDNREPQ